MSAVERLAAAGVALAQMGVICFFRAQVALVRSLLERRLPRLQQEEQRRRESATPAGNSWSCEPEAAAGDEGVVDLSARPSRPRRRGAAGQHSRSDEAGKGDEADVGQAAQGIQVATVDSFQARGQCLLRNQAAMEIPLPPLLVL